MLSQTQSKLLVLATCYLLLLSQPLAAKDPPKNGCVRRIVSAGVVLAALAYGGVNAYMYTYQRDLMYFPDSSVLSSVGTKEFVPWKTSDGQFLGYVRRADHTKKVILFFGGNSGEAIDYRWLDKSFPDNDTTIALVEYPGFGKRPGSPTEVALNETGILAFDEARKMTDAPIRVMGYSLGCAVALYTGAQRPVDRIGLIAPFYSMEALASADYPYLLVSLLLKDRYRNFESATKITAPLVLLHGDQDGIVPLADSQKLFKVIPGNRKTLIEVQGGNHSTVLSLLQQDDDNPFNQFIGGK